MRRDDFLRGIKRVMAPALKPQKSEDITQRIIFETAAAEETPNSEFGVIQTQPRYSRFFPVVHIYRIAPGDVAGLFDLDYCQLCSHDGHFSACCIFR